MDPNATLKGIRDLVKTINHDYEDPEGNGVDQDDAASLASHCETLDAWLCKGGFIPQDWQRASDEGLYATILRLLGENESRCCDDKDDREQLALALSMGLQKP
jgi:hypothetical protein